MSPSAGAPADAAPVTTTKLVRAFEPVLARDDAAARLAASRVWRLGRRPAHQPGHLELVHLPYRLATILARRSGSGNASDQPHATGVLTCLVCANTGLAFRFDASRRALATTEAAPLAARLEVAELDARALDFLQRLAAAPGSPRGARLDGALRSEDRAYPIWLSIYERGRRLDVTGVDALTGERIGSATRQALLLALLRSGGTS
jgi:hypothetical protein